MDSPCSEEKERTGEANGILLFFLSGEALHQWVMTLKSTVFPVWGTHSYPSLLEQKMMYTCKNFKSVWLEFYVAETLQFFFMFQLLKYD